VIAFLHHQAAPTQLTGSALGDGAAGGASTDDEQFGFLEHGGLVVTGSLPA
jgi:hypothetical protein